MECWLPNPVWEGLRVYGAPISRLRDGSKGLPEELRFAESWYGKGIAAALRNPIGRKA